MPISPLECKNVKSLFYIDLPSYCVGKVATYFLIKNRPDSNFYKLESMKKKDVS